MPIIACRGKPSWSGSVTATICMTPVSSSRWTRWRTAASESPTALPMLAYGMPAVPLKLFDDLLGDVVEHRGFAVREMVGRSVAVRPAQSCLPDGSFAPHRSASRRFDERRSATRPESHAFRGQGASTTESLVAAASRVRISRLPNPCHSWPTTPRSRQCVHRPLPNRCRPRPPSVSRPRAVPAHVMRGALAGRCPAPDAGGALSRLRHQGRGKQTEASCVSDDLSGDREEDQLLQLAAYIDVDETTSRSPHPRRSSSSADRIAGHLHRGHQRQ